MKITIPLPRETPRFLARRLGYAEFQDPRTGKISYVRRLTGGFYPRFHLYLEEKKNELIFDLHLDQKKPSYSGAHAHNAEYEGGAVEGEGGRIKSMLGII